MKPESHALFPAPIAASLSRSGKSLGVITAGLATAVVGLSLWFWLSGNPPVDAATGQAIADSFLQKIKDGKPQLAWDETSAEFKSDIGREDFVRDVHRQSVLRQPLTFQRFADLPDRPLPLRECIYSAPPQDGKPSRQIRVWLGLDGEHWKVERLFVD